MPAPTPLHKPQTPTAFDKQELALLSDFARLPQRDPQLVRQMVGVMLRTP